MKDDSRLAAILDRNLYGRSFFFISVPYLIIGLVIQFLLHWLAFPFLLIVYLPFFFGLVIVSGFVTKNFKKEFHHMGTSFAFLLFITGILSKWAAVTFPFEATLIGVLQFLLVLIISEAAFMTSIIMIVISGQRASLRKSIGLEEDFFEKEKRKWKNTLDEFPNLNKILESLDGGRFIAGLFDKGFFNLTILWSCNVMEEVVDVVVDGIISLNSERGKSIRTGNGHRLPYPIQLRKLGYKSYQNKNKFNVDTLWHEVRNKIAHHNYRPTFKETDETLKILISFVREMPMILHSCQKVGSVKKS